MAKYIGEKRIAFNVQNITKITNIKNIIDGCVGRAVCDDGFYTIQEIFPLVKKLLTREEKRLFGDNRIKTLISNALFEYKFNHYF